MWNGKFIVGLSYAEEFAHKEYRKDIVMLSFAIGTLTMICTSLCFILVSRSWKPSNIAGIMFAAISLGITPWYCPESPKYLYESYRFDEARQSLYSIARRNRVLVLDTIKFDKESPYHFEEVTHDKKSVLWTDPIHKQNLTSLVLQWGCSMFSNYMIQFNLKYLAGNIFFNTISVSISNLISQISVNVIVKRFGFKKTYIFSYAIVITACSIILLSSFIFEEDESLYLMPMLLLAAGFGCNNLMVISY